ncbi:MAG: Flp family type IVb pilin [Microthrixaceae bacterium]|nr:Flp family type IVb pilin [Microthrixaceae bacterium]
MLLSPSTRPGLSPPSERGASLVEYALLLALLALVCVAAVSTFGSATANSLNSSAGLL